MKNRIKSDCKSSQSGAARSGSRSAKAKLMMTAATLATGFMGYGRSAYAQVVSTPCDDTIGFIGGYDTYGATCYGNITEEVAISVDTGEDIAVTIQSGTNINVSGDTAISLYNDSVIGVDSMFRTRSGDVTIDDSGNTISGLGRGVSVSAEGGQVDLSMRSDITVTGEDGQRGIEVYAGSITGGRSHYIDIYGDVSAQDGTAIYVEVNPGVYGEELIIAQQNQAFGEDATGLAVSIQNEAQITGRTGIDLANYGSGYIALEVEEGSTVTGDDGIAISVNGGEGGSFTQISLYDGTTVNGDIVLEGGARDLYFGEDGQGYYYYTPFGGSVLVGALGGVTVNGDIVDNTRSNSRNLFGGTGATVAVFADSVVEGSVLLGEDNDVFVTDGTNSVTNIVDGGFEPRTTGFDVAVTGDTTQPSEMIGFPGYGDQLIFIATPFYNYSGEEIVRPQTEVDLSVIDFDGDQAEGERFINFEQVIVSSSIYGGGPFGGHVELTGSTDQYGYIYGSGVIEISGDAPDIDLLMGEDGFFGGPVTAQSNEITQRPVFRPSIVAGDGTIGSVQSYGYGMIISPGALNDPELIVIEQPREPIDEYDTPSLDPSPILPFTSEIGTLTVEGEIRTTLLRRVALDEIPDGEEEPPVPPAPNLLDIQIAGDGSADLLVVEGFMDLSSFDLLVRTDDMPSDFGNAQGIVVVDGSDLEGELNSVIDTVVDVDVIAESNNNEVTLSWALSDEQSDKSAVAGGGFAAATGHLAFTSAMGGGLSGAAPVGSESGLIETTQGVFSPAGGDTTEVVSNARLFGNVLGEQAEVDAQDDLAGLDATVTGGFVGLQTSVAVDGGSLTFGGAVGQTNTESEVEDGSADVTGLHAGVFAGYSTGALTISGLVSFASLDMETFRELGATDGEGETEGTSWAADLKVSRDISDMLGAGDVNIAPYLGYRTINTKFDGFSEEGTTLEVEDTEISTQYVSLGADFARTVTVGQMDIGTSLSIGVEHAMGDLSVTSISNVGIGDDFVTETAPIDENRGLLGLGISFGQDNLTGSIGFEGAFGENSSEQAVVLGVSYKF